MKIMFWISAVAMLIGEYYLVNGFVNVYFKNYNGGPSSSSGSIVYTMLIVLGIIVAGFWLYFTGRFKWATAVMGLPILLLILYLLVILIIPAIMGERMN